MALIVNGVTIPSSGVVTYNDVSLDKVICNGVEVFSKGAPSGTREPASGEYYSNNSPLFLWFVNDKYPNNYFYWNSIQTNLAYGKTSYSDGTYTYYRSSTRYYYSSTSKVSHYGIYRIKN